MEQQNESCIDDILEECLGPIGTDPEIIIEPDEIAKLDLFVDIETQPPKGNIQYDDFRSIY